MTDEYYFQCKESKAAASADVSLVPMKGAGWKSQMRRAWLDNRALWAQHTPTDGRLHGTKFQENWISYGRFLCCVLTRLTAAEQRAWLLNNAQQNDLFHLPHRFFSGLQFQQIRNTFVDLVDKTCVMWVLLWSMHTSLVSWEDASTLSRREPNRMWRVELCGNCLPFKRCPRWNFSCALCR